MKHIINDTDKNKFEAMDKAETLAAIQQIIEEGEIPQELLNGIALTLRNPIDNQDYKIAFCTQAKYNELEQAGQLETNCYYYITDDTTWEDFVEYIERQLTDITSDLNSRVEELESYPMDIAIDSQYPNRSVDLSDVFDNGAIFSFCFEATYATGTISQVRQISGILHINDKTKPCSNVGVASEENAQVNVGWNTTNHFLVCDIPAGSGSHYSNPQFTSIKLLAKW
jgi:hypothetical protein